MKPMSGKGYPAASAMPTRASAAEAHLDDDAATALDPPRFVAWDAPEPLPPEPETAPVPASEAAHVPTLPAALPAVLAWVAIAMLGVLSGIAGALFGIWLAFGGG